MVYTPPGNKNPGDPISASDYNVYSAANIAYLFNGRPGSQIKRNNAADYTTTSASFVDVDATNLAIITTINSGKVQVAFSCILSNSVGAISYLNLTVDGVSQGATNGITHKSIGIAEEMFTFVFMIPSLSIGSHTFKVQWKTASGTLTMRSTANDFVWYQVEEIG